MTDIYNRFDPSKQFERHLFRAAKGLQSAELNEVQSAIFNRLQGVSDVIFKDGAVLSGSQPIVTEAGEVRLFDCVVYVRGAARPVAETVLNVPVVGEVTIGVYLQETVVTELEDPTLRDPAIGTRNYDEPGAARLKAQLVWGVSNDGSTGGFYPVYTILNGVMLQNSPPPELDGVLQLVARYDRNSNGHYIVDGMTTRYVSEANGEQIFTISEGDAHVDGFEVTKVNAQRLVVPAVPDLSNVIGEPHTFNDSGDGTATITLNRGPIAVVSAVRVTKRTTTTITHGGFTGVSDPLPDEAVIAVVSVVQGGTTYSAGSDYVFTGGELDWSPGGLEPAPGSSYQVTYDHIVVVPPLEVTSTTVKIGIALTGTVAYFDYSWKLPRIDRIAIDHKGIISLVQGQPSRFSPKPATVPRNLLALSLVYQTWTGAPQIVNDGVKVTPMSELEQIKSQVSDLYDLVAQERLRNDANLSDPAAKKGVFVDPFINDALRDQGEAQTASIVGGMLMLSIEAEIDELSAAMAPTEMLPFTYDAIIDQDKGTGQMKINPYMAFDPVPAKVRLNAAVDRFTQVIGTSWASPITQRIWEWSNSGRIADGTLLSTTTTTQESSRVVGEAEFLRQITISVTAEGFGPNEVVQSITFDGVDVTPA